jgi:preprotein translocase subunit Sss1
MTLLGVVGVTGLWATRRARRPSDGIAEGWISSMKVTNIPLTIVGVVGAVIWIVAAVR